MFQNSAKPAFFLHNWPTLIPIKFQDLLNFFVSWDTFALENLLLFLSPFKPWPQHNGYSTTAQSPAGYAFLRLHTGRLWVCLRQPLEIMIHLPDLHHLHQFWDKKIQLFVKFKNFQNSISIQFQKLELAPTRCRLADDVFNAITAQQKHAKAHSQVRQQLHGLRHGFTVLVTATSHVSS